MSHAVGLLCLVLPAGAFALFLVWLERSVKKSLARALAALAERSCPACGQRIGEAGARAAHEADQREKQAALAQARDLTLRLRVDPAWRFACPSCGVGLRYDPEALALAADGRTR